MTPVARTPFGWRVAVTTILILHVLAPPAQALRILNYNLLNYPGSSGPARNPHFRNILQQIHPDIVFAQEVLSQAGVDAFLANVLNASEPGQWAALQFVDGNDTDGAMFYKPSQFTPVGTGVSGPGQWSYYPDATLLRLIHVYRVRPVGYTTNAADIRFHSVHLKASDTSADANRRFNEATGMRDSMNAMPPGTHAFGIGDFNFYRSTSAEPAYGKLLESQVDNDGRLYDPLGLGNMVWNNNATIAQYHTQCPCNTGCLNGSVGGAMDDRFDLILPTFNWNDGQGYELIPSTYKAFGNDGAHFNVAINVPPYTVIDSVTAYGLWFASDHLPLYVDIQVPAIAGVPASLALGDVIVGGSTDLSISNLAVAPADDLTYSLVTPEGFTAPGGIFNLASGAGAQHAIGADALPPYGARSGSLLVSSDDVDNPSRLIPLTANVFDHAHASLDSTSETTGGVADFGTLPAGAFTPQTVAVHNAGYSSVQARLSVTGGAITGGDGRFSIAGGFSPSLVADVGQRYELLFDDTDATLDSTYTATLTFTSTDEALPGASPRPDLTVALSARVSSGPLASPRSAPPAATRLYTPFPNPIRGASRIALDLATQADVRLDVLDLAGRSVAQIVHRELEAGRHAFAWSGAGAGGAAVPAGVYFMRLSGRGVSTQTVRLAVIR